MAIPKIIHYCWFGGKEKPDNVKRCIASWKKNMSDFEFIEWNEGNFDINQLIYTKQAYEAKKYAFVSDVARIQALYQYGGFYMDTDVEVFKSFDALRSDRCVLGIEEGNFVATSFIGIEKEHFLIKEFIDLYENLTFYDENGNINTGTNVAKLTNILISKGFVQENRYQELEDGIHIYTKEYFSPYDYINCHYNITENTYCVHHFFVSWMPWEVRIKKLVKKYLVKIIGVNHMNEIRELWNK